MPVLPHAVLPPQLFLLLRLLLLLLCMHPYRIGLSKIKLRVGLRFFCKLLPVDDAACCCFPPTFLLLLLQLLLLFL